MTDILGFDVGGTWIRAIGPGVGLDEAIRAPTPGSVSEIPGVIGDMSSAAGWRSVDAVGIGCAGLVDHSSGVLRWMPHASGRDVALGPELVGLLGAPVWVDNDANAAALAEATDGSGAGHRLVVMVTVGTGIGLGMVVDGRVERGRAHLGEAGHMRVGDGPTCVCGRIGCWEEMASGRALDAAARSIRDGADGRWLLARCDEGDEGAIEAVDRVACSLWNGLESLALLLDPDVIVVGGGVGPALLGRGRRRQPAGSLGEVGLPKVVPAAFGAAAGLRGAMIGAMEVLG